MISFAQKHEPVRPYNQSHPQMLLMLTYDPTFPQVNLELIASQYEKINKLFQTAHDSFLKRRNKGHGYFDHHRNKA